MQEARPSLHAPGRGCRVLRSQSPSLSAPYHAAPLPGQEHEEDAGDASKVEGDTVTDRAVLEGKAGPGHTASV